MKLVVSMGDCNGIGIEVMIKAITSFDLQSAFANETDITVAGNLDTIKEYVKHYKYPSGDFPVWFEDNGIIINKRYCTILECENYSPVEFGEETVSAGKLAAEAITKALDATINNEFDAFVTMPVSKAVLYKSGWKFPGHTEMLADRCGIEKPMMILCDMDIRVAIATIHIPIKDVPGTLTANHIIERIETFNNSLINDYGIDNPKIALLGLNPHAGEDGGIGLEENETIIPAMEQTIKNGVKADGPFPADGFFAHGAYKNYDGILAMYHDQGLIPLKMLAKGGGVNVTAGLPIVRTSPDHGTAFEIAGTGIANEASSTMALELAARISLSRKNKLSY